ncbi:Uncharacterized protein T10_4605, partial [Trichinella papuae]
LYEQSDNSISSLIFLCFLHVVIRRYVDTLLQLRKAFKGKSYFNFSRCSNRECSTAVISVTFGCVLSCCNMHEQYFCFSSMEQQSVVESKKSCSNSTCATGPRNCFKITAVESRIVGIQENPTGKNVEKCCSNGITKVSRFHIVKVLDDPYRRGRWFCKESEDKQPSPVEAKTTTKSASDINCTVVNGPGRKFTVCPVVLPEEKEKPAKPDVEVRRRFTVTPVVETTALTKPAEECGVQVVGEPSRKFTISAVSTLRDGEALDETLEEEEEDDDDDIDDDDDETDEQPQQEDIIALNEKPVTRRSSVPGVLSSPGCATSTSGFAVSSVTQNSVATSPTAGRKASCPVPTTPVERSSPHSRPRQPIAIDSKIEQAMNLVKTHLQYAVREEVDELKNRIAHLERQVERLETENRRLRQCEMELQRLQQQQQQQQQPSHSGKMQ